MHLRKAFRHPGLRIVILLVFLTHAVNIKFDSVKKKNKFMAHSWRTTYVWPWFSWDIRILTLWAFGRLYPLEYPLPIDPEKLRKDVNMETLNVRVKSNKPLLDVNGNQIESEGESMTEQWEIKPMAIIAEPYPVMKNDLPDGRETYLIMAVVDFPGIGAMVVHTVIAKTEDGSLQNSREQVWLFEKPAPQWVDRLMAAQLPLAQYIKVADVLGLQ
jgi:hypothetical protein